MSQHAIEDTVSASIRALHKHDGAAPDLRDLFYGLYQFQRGFDCGFTHGRELKILVERGYTYRLPIESHPKYADHKAAFKRAAKQDEILFVRREVLGEEIDDENPGVGNEDGYVTDGALHCDAGTPLWGELVQKGVLTGESARPPKAPPLPTIARRVALVAEKADDADLVIGWIQLGPRVLFRDAFKRRVKKGEVFGVNPHSKKPLVADEDKEVLGPITIEALSQLEDARALREIGQRMKVAEAIAADDPFYEDRTEAERWFFGE